jgi:hypothetical protein
MNLLSQKLVRYKMPCLKFRERSPGFINAGGVHGLWNILVAGTCNETAGTERHSSADNAGLLTRWKQERTEI